jgi:hypothetical protein
MVAHLCSGGRDQEDHSLRTAQEKVKPYVKNIQYRKKGLMEWFK